MSDSFWIALFTTIGGTVLPTVAAVLAYLKSKDNEQQIKRLSINVDGRLSQLLVATEAKAHAEGVIQGGGAGPGSPQTLAAEAILSDARKRALTLLEEARRKAEGMLNDTQAIAENTDATRANTEAMNQPHPERSG